MGARTRLDTVDSRVGEHFRSASPARRREAALIACERAVASVRQSSPQVSRALDVLRGLTPRGADLRMQLQEAEVELDDRYLRLIDDGNPDHEQQALDLFSLARITAALGFALSDDDTEFHEAIYEASAAVQDPDIVLLAVDPVLTGRMHSQWYVIHGGKRVALLDHPQIEDMFWWSYQVTALPDSPADLFSPEFWKGVFEVEDLTSGVRIPGVFAGGPSVQPRANGQRVWLRGFYPMEAEPESRSWTKRFLSLFRRRRRR
jgi:hypothetical protein